ncbi:MAG TPA: hypothetical protein VHN74_10700 [Candidatus Angelobacter sp.]|nr:hypothetical protein [Candidatus Angelobacter sp.]
MKFTAVQVDIIYVGLRVLILNHITLQKTGRSPGAHPDILTLKYINRRGACDAQILEAIYRLWSTLQVCRGKALRTSLEYIEICACALAVRTAVRQMRHGHLAVWAGGIEGAAKRLLRSLEAIRKRLKRTIRKTKGDSSFRELAHGWRQFLRWARLNLLTCPCLIRRPNPFYRSRQRLIDAMVDVATVELQRLKRALPPPGIRDRCYIRKKFHRRIIAFEE